MTYTKNTWANGDVITAAKLNNIENGIAAAGGSLVVHMDVNNTLDKTWQEIHDALASGARVVTPLTWYEGDADYDGWSATHVEQVFFYMTTEFFDGETTTYMATGARVGEQQDYLIGNPLVYDATSANGYPVLRSS